MKHRIQSRSQAGFSLVEVTLAVGIATLAIITLLGLLPQGLEMSRKTAVMVADSNILEQITHDLENATFAALDAQLGQAGQGQGQKLKKYYNDQGREVLSDAVDIAYVVQIEQQAIVSIPKAEVTQPYLRRMIIKIANSSSSSFNFDSTDSAPSYVTFNQLIAKTR